MSRRDDMRKALADAGVAVQQGEWQATLLDRLEAAADLETARYRDRVLTAIAGAASPGMELRQDGSEDPVTGAYVDGVRTARSDAAAVPLTPEPDALPVPEEESNPT